MRYLCKRGGVSGIRRNGGGAAAPPAGMTYDKFLEISDDEKYNLMDKIINDANMKVPDYLDDSVTSKIMYALGINNKPTVVSDSELDKLPGKDLYRAFHDNPDSNISSKDIAGQLKYGDYTQLSGKGGSAFGRGIYFAEDNFGDAVEYGSYGDNILITRAKLKPNSKMSTINEIQNKINKDLSFGKTFMSLNDDDKPAIYALAHGIDGWRAKAGYNAIIGGEITTQPVIHTAIINRKSLIFSSTNKGVRNKDNSDYSFSWVDAKDV